MKLANIVLKMDMIGNSVPKKHVTPAEVMFLVADHSRNAGGDPILSLVPVPDNAEEASLKKLREDLDKWTAKLQELEDLEVTPEIREKREESYRTQIQRRQEHIEELVHLQKRRTFSTTQERSRLGAIYGIRRIKKMFPGAIPTLPEDFKEARTGGIGAAGSDDEDKFEGYIAESKGA